MSDEPKLAEATMIYRASEEETAVEIWGKKVETRVVDASEVPDLLAEGWVKSPLDLADKPAPKADEAKKPTLGVKA